MNWNDYEAVWKRQELPVGPDADLASLRETFETKRRKMAATLFLRDVIEASAGVVVSIALAFIWWQQKKVGWPIALAIVLTLGVTGFFIKERIRAHRNRLGPDASMLAKLEADIAELVHQRRLLMNVWKWYLAPITAAIVIVGVTISLNRPPWDLSRDPVFLGCFHGFLALFLWGVWALNRRVVRKQIDPRLAELEKLRRDILTTE
jgi:hypothetical protein